MSTLIRRLRRALTNRGSGQTSPTRRLHLEHLEARTVLSGNVLQTNLVSDLPGVALFQDPHLVNPWGISDSASTPATPTTPFKPGSPFWISDNNAGVSTLYNTAGAPQKLVVSIPAPGDPLGTSGAPTGTVFNTSKGGFQVSNGTKSAAAIFLFATEDGTIAGWNPGINPVGSDPAKAGTFATLAVDNSANPTAADGAVYKGLAIATDANGRSLLYAANFRAGTIDVFDANFKPVTTLPAGAFTDTDLPKGYAPFNVQELGGKIYVTYAKQNADKHDDIGGEHHGFVDVFNLDGSGGKRLISRGPLDSPWGVALAPASFGNLGGALLVGNFRNGHINAFDPKTGKFLAELKDPDGEPIQIDGLWALKVGNGGNGGDANNIYFTAGLDHEQHGLFGSLAPVAQGTPEGPAEVQALQAAVDVFQIDLATVQKDITTGVTGTTLQQDLQALNTAFVDLVRAELRFAADSRADLFPQGHHERHHGDLDDLFADLGGEGDR